MNSCAKFAKAWMELRGWTCEDTFDPVKQFNFFSASKQNSNIAVGAYFGLSGFTDAETLQAAWSNSMHIIRSVVPITQFPFVAIDFSIDREFAVIVQISENDPKLKKTVVEKKKYDTLMFKPRQQDIHKVPVSDVLARLGVDSIWDVG